jgi:hypothetical protein
MSPSAKYAFYMSANPLCASLTTPRPGIERTVLSLPSGNISRPNAKPLLDQAKVRKNTTREFCAPTHERRGIHKWSIHRGLARCIARCRERLRACRQLGVTYICHPPARILRFSFLERLGRRRTLTTVDLGPLRSSWPQKLIHKFVQPGFPRVKLRLLPVANSPIAPAGWTTY